MSPNLALIAGIVGILFFFLLDRIVFKYEQGMPLQLVPLIWFMILGSRMVSYWFDSQSMITDPYMEGSPLDRNLLSVLIVVGTIAVVRRKVYWVGLIRHNAWLVVFFLYSGVSILWSGFPFIAFKRYIKEIGTLIFVLVLLMDERRVVTVRRLIMRTTYVLVPMSIILFKYFPHLGRYYHVYSGELSITGVSVGKNGLGVLSAICAFTVSWVYLAMKPLVRGRIRTLFFFLIVSSYILSMWTLVSSNSKTALVCFVAATGTLLILRQRWTTRNVRSVLLIFLGSFGILFLLQITTDIFGFLITQVLGRDITLTGRTDLWQELIRMSRKPILGYGFNSFWLGGRLAHLHSKHWWTPTQAHNAFLETYLNGGLVGVILITLVFLSTFQRTVRKLAQDYDFGVFRMAVLVFAVLFAITEAYFMVFHIVWFMFLLISIEMPSSSSPGKLIKELV